MFFSFYEALILSRPRLVLALLAALVLGLATAIPRTAFDASSDSLVLEGDSSLDYYRTISKRYDSADFLVVAYTPNHVLFSEEGIAKLTQLHTALAALDGVTQVNSILDVPLIYSPKASLSDLAGGLKTIREGDVDLELAKREFSQSPVYKSLLTNAAATTTALQLNIAGDPKYRALQRQRDDLRELARTAPLSDAESIQLQQVTKEFKDYKLIAAERQERLVQQARSVLAAHSGFGELFLGGVPMIAVDMVNFIKGDLATLGLGGAVVIVALMVFFFRRARWVAIPLVTVAITIAAMLGGLAWVDWRMTVISSNFVAILLVINLSILIHLVVRYRELATEHPEWTVRDLVVSTMRFMAKPCIYTTLTTLVAFASLVISGIRPVIDFGWMMTIGVLVALLASYIVLPCLLLVLPRELVKPDTPKPPITLKFALVVDKYGRQLLAVVGLLVVLTVYGLTRLEVETRFIDYFHEDTEIYQGMQKIDAELGGTIPLDVVISAPSDSDATIVVDDHQGVDASLELDDEFFDDGFGDDMFASDNEVDLSETVWFTRSGMERVKAAHDYLDAIPELGKILSLATLYEVLGDLGGKDVDDIQLALVKENLPPLVDEVMVKPYFDEQTKEVRISARAMETSHTLKRNELINRINTEMVDTLGFEPGQVKLTGMLVLYNNMLQSLYRSQILTLGAVFIAIMAMFYVLFRSFKLAAIAIFPNLLAATLVLGGMGIAGIPLDLMTITIAAICIGIGVDDTVHYIYRFREEFKLDGNYHESMYRSHASIGQAMYYTSVIIVVGFGVLALSNFKPTIYFGLLTGAGMVAALLGALLVLPKLIVIFKPFGAERP